jgi:hypothetical protein
MNYCVKVHISVNKFFYNYSYFILIFYFLYEKILCCRVYEGYFLLMNEASSANSSCGNHFIRVFGTILAKEEYGKYFSEMECSFW